MNVGVHSLIFKMVIGFLLLLFFIVTSPCFSYEVLDCVTGMQASFVLCRVFVGSRQRNNNNISEQISGSCGEVSVTTVRHVGVQHDGTSPPINTESKLHDNSIDRENEVFTFPVGLVDEHDQVTREPVGEQVLYLTLLVSSNVLLFMVII